MTLDIVKELDNAAPNMASDSLEQRAAREIELLREVSDKLAEALAVMVSEKRDYMIRNALGNPEVEHATKMARAALAEVAAIRKRHDS